MKDLAKSQCVSSSHTEIDWEDLNKVDTKFENGLADAYLGKTLQSDMTFLLELDGTTIPAHSLFIAAGSQVLEKMIFGSGRLENPDRVVKVPDCPQREFMILLRCLYTRVIPDLTIEEATVLLPLVHYFDIQHIEASCAKRIEESLTPQNVCTTFDRIHFMDNSLTDKCITIMRSHTDQILADGSLMKMQDAALTKVLAPNGWLDISCESDLLKPMIVWADKQFVGKKRKKTPVSRREILKDRIYLIRFAAMSSDAFEKCIAMVGPDFFTPDEIASTMLSISLKKEYKLSADQKTFNFKRRVNRVEVPSVYSQQYYGYGPTTQTTTEKLSLRNITDDVSLVGFETLNSVSKIFVDSETIEMKFVQSENRIIFTQPIKLVNGQCIIKIQSCGQSHYKTTQMTNTDVFLPPNMGTSIKAILYK